MLCTDSGGKGLVNTFPFQGRRRGRPQVVPVAAGRWGTSSACRPAFPQCRSSLNGRQRGYVEHGGLLLPEKKPHISFTNILF